MKKSELIEKLSAIPGDFSVFVNLGDNVGAKAINKVIESELFYTDFNEDGTNGVPVITIEVV